MPHIPPNPFDPLDEIDRFEAVMLVVSFIFIGFIIGVAI